jgi:hypothetical protein
VPGTYGGTGSTPWFRPNTERLRIFPTVMSVADEFSSKSLNEVALVPAAATAKQKFAGLNLEPLRTTDVWKVRK